MSLPRLPGKPLRWANRSLTVTVAVARSSWRAKPGSMSRMRLSHETLPSPTRAATTVEASGLESEASWKTVSTSTASGLPTWRTPKPSRKTTSSPWTMAIDRPGTSFLSMVCRANSLSLGRAAATFSWVAVCATAGSGTSSVAAPASSARRVVGERRLFGTRVMGCLASKAVRFGDLSLPAGLGRAWMLSVKENGQLLARVFSGGSYGRLEQVMLHVDRKVAPCRTDRMAERCDKSIGSHSIPSFAVGSPFPARASSRVRISHDQALQRHRNQFSGPLRLTIGGPLGDRLPNILHQEGASLTCDSRMRSSRCPGRETARGTASRLHFASPRYARCNHE